jgi:hypothetical protein
VFEIGAVGRDNEQIHAAAPAEKRIDCVLLGPKSQLFFGKVEKGPYYGRGDRRRGGNRCVPFGRPFHER